MAIILKVKKEDLNRILNKLSRLSPENQYPTFKAAWREASSFLTRALQFNLSGRFLKSRSGNLAKFQYRLLVNPIRSIIANRALSGKSVPYTNIHEYGGTIRPKNAKHLAIPIGKALTPTGKLRFRPRDIEKHYDDSRVLKSKKGNLIMFGVKELKTKTKLVPLFVLKHKVTIPARHYASRTVKESSKKFVQYLEQWVDKELKK